MVVTLAEFLLARIAEDEATAKATTRPWVIGPMRTTADLQHIVGWDPARVLAECEAKRRIIEHHERWQATLHETPEGWTEQTATAYRMAMEWTVRQLALPFADHPDYSEEWKP